MSRVPKPGNSDLTTTNPPLLAVANAGDLGKRSNFRTIHSIGILTQVIAIEPRPELKLTTFVLIVKATDGSWTKTTRRRYSKFREIYLKVGAEINHGKTFWNKKRFNFPGRHLETFGKLFLDSQKEKRRKGLDEFMQQLNSLELSQELLQLVCDFLGFAHPALMNVLPTHESPNKEMEQFLLSRPELNIQQWYWREGGTSFVHAGLYSVSGFENVPVAIKQRKPMLLDDDDSFLREIDILGHIRHPGIVEKIDGVCRGPLQYLVTSKGNKIAPTVSDLLEAFPPLPSPANSTPKKQMSWEFRMCIALDIAKAMCYCHTQARVCHLDLCSDNVLVRLPAQSSTESGVYTPIQSTVRLCDFGSAQYIDKLASLSADDVMYTPSHVAPELIRKERFDERVDVYSFAIICAELCLGRNFLSGFPLMLGPFLTVVANGQRPAVRNTSAPEAFVTLIEQCWNDSPSARPSFTEVVSQLEDILKRCPAAYFSDVLSTLHQELRQQPAFEGTTETPKSVVGFNNFNSDNYCVVKTLLTGDSGVGKSCLMIQFIDGPFSGKYFSTIGVEFGTKTVQVANQKYKLQIWDTAGQERFRSTSLKYYRGAQLILVVFDLTNRESFDHVTGWVDQMEEYANHEAVKILAGNKVDMPAHRVVTFEEAAKLADLLGFQMYFETSARSGANVDKVFETGTYLLVQQSKERNLENKPRESNPFFWRRK
eukprot:c7208_g1_i3.p1 GENE.c7208_g1_i3~~c7208_g1_i3.p1  ORF type:complete len:744 (+),score=151.70 c7208_g1_i3:104-2233(+)